ncbi:MAG: beta-lactamase family protein [Bacteroidales bacterium]|nr:beta-lactamase family protein [Bacteroidales bacterium]
MKKITLFALCALLLAACTGNSYQAFEEDLNAFREEVGNVGLGVAVVKDNKIIYDNYFGVKNLETGEKIDAQSIFRIASISKSFTATAFMQLVEEGKVTLESDVSDLMGFTVRNPKYPETVITLEMLLSHTSSLNDTQGYFTLDVINPATNPNSAACYNDYEPGKGYQYCNLNFNMAGTILEKLSGERFDHYIVNHILNPLGLYGGYNIDALDSTRFAILYSYNPENDSLEAQPGAYRSRAEDIANYVTGYSTPIFSPTGGMKISTTDLAKYMMVHMNYGIYPGTQERIISEESSKNMQTPRSEDEHYGLALWRTTEYIPEIELVGHTGSAYGLRSAMFFHPEEKYGFVVISSGAKASDTELLKGIIKLMYDHFIANE